MLLLLVNVTTTPVLTLLLLSAVLLYVAVIAVHVAYVLVNVCDVVASKCHHWCGINVAVAVYSAAAAIMLLSLCVKCCMYVSHFM